LHQSRKQGQYAEAGKDTDIAMLTADLLDIHERGSANLVIGVTSSIPCLLRVKGRKGGGNLMGANVARVHREPILVIIAEPFLFTFARLPPSQWHSGRTANAVERLDEEFKRRIKT
jgi:hypothetical protein